MSDKALTIHVLAGDEEIARATTYPEGAGSITIDRETPRPVARVGISALESICLSLRQVASGGGVDVGMSALTFDERMRPVATDAQVHAVAVMLAGIFDSLTDTPADTAAEAYAKLDGEERQGVGGMARLLLDVAREAGD